MRLLRLAAACLLATAVAIPAFASPANPQNGVDYTTLAQPQPVQTSGKKVEVIEFFMYHCPVCNGLEPGFEEWVKKQGDRIQVRRIHMPFTGANDPEAHLFLTLEALGKLDEMHGKVFDAVHKQRIRLNQDGPIIDWVSKNGIDRATFLNAWNSFGVQTRLRGLDRVLGAYKVETVPTLVIDGRYVTSPGQVNASLKTNNPQEMFQATLQVADALVAKALQSK
ncbi:thiol:disulfide interchange protein DsbA/DsbL [Massilia sp. 2TAF26]|uniref:thiol:disulfide interchange protein DsbA/DsbL n=1 Tax=Massilia sp. 2TAF26 TaxID=3233012 RepID=UPI003F98F768